LKSNSEAAGTSYLYTFPFWVYLDPASPPEILSSHLRDYSFRLYPPFRSGPANFTTMPEVAPLNIPFVSGQRPDIGPDLKIPSQVLIPDLVRREGGRRAAMLVTGSEWNKLTETPPADSLRVDVWRAPNTQQIADRLVQRLISLLRWRSRQWWVGRSIDAWLGYRRCTFPISEDGSPLSGPEPHAQLNVIGSNILTVIGDERPVDRAIWESVSNDLASSNDSPSHIIYLLDARYFTFRGDLRRGILDMVVACEQARDLAFERLRRKVRGTDLLSHITDELKRVGGRSYEEEHPSDYQWVRKLWITRGNIAHGRPTALDDLTAFQFLRAAEQCVQWLDGVFRAP
jgi:hypothetical protein